MLILRARGHTRVASVAIRKRFLAVQQLARLGDICHVRRRGRDAVWRSGVTSYSASSIAGEGTDARGRVMQEQLPARCSQTGSASNECAASWQSDTGIDPCGFRIMRFDQCQQPILGHDVFHRGQEPLTPCALAFAFAAAFAIAETKLGHHCGEALEGGI